MLRFNTHSGRQKTTNEKKKLQKPEYPSLLVIIIASSSALLRTSRNLPGLTPVQKASVAVRFYYDASHSQVKVAIKPITNETYNVTRYQVALLTVKVNAKTHWAPFVTDKRANPGLGGTESLRL